ncbi:MAG: transglutaminase-like domain-containing protein [Acidocella sp.]|nr:transglutaminase-like domain-containing protein [Acidocella sp.]
MTRVKIWPHVNERYRSIPQARILDMLLLLGWAFEVAAGARAAAELQCAEALESLIGAGLGYCARANGERCFDPAEVLNFVKAEGLAGRSHIWTDHFIPTARAQYQSLAALTGGNTQLRAHVRFSRIFSLHGIATGSRLRLTLPVPITCSYGRGCKVSWDPMPYPATQGVLRDTCLDIRIAAAPPPPVTLAAEFNFTALTGPDQQRPTPDELALYLRHAEGLIRVTPRIQSLATALAGDTTSPHNAATKFFDFMLEHLMMGMIRYSDIPADDPGGWMLDHGWCDCLLGSAVFVALCRAHGIPARLLGGYFLYPLAPTNHYWAEIWIDGAGWLAFDLLTWDLSAAGRDAAWRHVFAGRCDARMVTQIFPAHFTGPMTAQLPPTWHLLQRRLGNGMVCSFHDAVDGSLIYEDQIECVHLNAVPQDDSIT